MYALNFLYSAKEIERMIAYEIKNAVSLPDDESSHFQVQASHSYLRYRITYVSPILLIGLLSIFFAGSISQSYTMWPADYQLPIMARHGYSPLVDR